jgi:transaldolase
MTLVFCLEQAISRAEAGLTLISPFIGRIFELYQFNNPGILADNCDRGVESVRKIFSDYNNGATRGKLWRRVLRISMKFRRLRGVIY